MSSLCSTIFDTQNVFFFRTEKSINSLGNRNWTRYNSYLDCSKIYAQKYLEYWCVMCVFIHVRLIQFRMWLWLNKISLSQNSSSNGKSETVNKLRKWEREKDSIRRKKMLVLMSWLMLFIYSIQYTYYYVHSMYNVEVYRIEITVRTIYATCTHV